MAETPTDRSRFERVAAAAPEPLARKIRASKLTGERKPVTAIFADVVGSTTLAETIDPEDWSQIMNGAFEVLSEAVYRYEGTVAQLQGDAMVVFFGAPVAHEDDPERAIRSALDMIAAVGEYAVQAKAEYGIEFAMRCGVNSGEVMVGNIGSDLRYEYTALGDTMNVAARMEAAAAPMTVLVTEDTYRLTSATFDFEEVGDLSLKGKTAPVKGYRVVGLRATPGRARGIEGMRSPMVGRDAELARLRELLATARAGTGRAAVIIGDPGLGKTRLLEELRASAIAENSPTHWVVGQCPTFGAALPYHLVIDIARSCLGISVADSLDDARAKLSRRVSELLTEGQEEAVATLAHLLGLTDQAITEEGQVIDQGALTTRIIGTVHRLLAALCATGTVVLVWEDIQWADPSSVEALSAAMPLFRKLRILLVAALRPDRDSGGWRLLTAAREVFGETLAELSLQPLSQAAGTELIGNLLEVESLPGKVRASIIARAEGNPFFVEEVVRMLMDRGVIVRDGDQWVATEDAAAVEIPETLRGLLLARIDRLPTDARRSLRVASVIGRQFPARVLEQVLEARSEEGPEP
ncbi:MAG: adenylate/guanylate cyclase domain-containing protein [Candidatus Dormiibacterota bacterium]